MDEVDGVLARLAVVPTLRPLGDDPAFVARLEASAARGEMMGLARSVALGVVVAGLMVAVHPGRTMGRAGGILLSTTDGEVL